MRLSTYKDSGGFTLIEVIIAVAIIGILTAAVIPSISNSREKSRDAQRIADLKRIEFALEVYREAEGAFPSGLGDGALIGVGGEIDGILQPFMGVVPRDPLSEGYGEGDFNYIYDAGFGNTCAEAVVYAKTVERAVNDNSAKCGGFGSGHIVTLGDTRIAGGGVTPTPGVWVSGARECARNERSDGVVDGGVCSPIGSTALEYAQPFNGECATNPYGRYLAHTTYTCEEEGSEPPPPPGGTWVFIGSSCEADISTAEPVTAGESCTSGGDQVAVYEGVGGDPCPGTLPYSHAFYVCD